MEYLYIGVMLGLTAGMSPGPLLALVVTETLSHGRNAGFKIAAAPLITDLPIIVLSLLILAPLSSHHIILGVISMIGALVVFSMGLSGLKTRRLELDLTENAPQSLQKGIIVNLLNPHPYIFWIGVGAPLILKAARSGISSAAAFLGSFYLLLVGSKVVMAVAVARSRRRLTGVVYKAVMKILGLLLCIFAGILFYDGLKLMGVV